jgi:SAM domain (Sterile alpha motif)
MSEYTDRFVENRIDLSVLPNLTDQDLEKLGVLLGDRRKMLRAIRDLGSAAVDATVPGTNSCHDLATVVGLGGQRRCRLHRLCLHLGASFVSLSAQLERDPTVFPLVDNNNRCLHRAAMSPQLVKGMSSSLLFGDRSLGGGAYASAPS